MLPATVLDLQPASTASHPWSPWIVPALLGLLFLRWLIEMVLAYLNERATLARSHDIPAAFRELMDPETYAKSVRYTLAKSQFGQLESTFHTSLLIILLLTALLPTTYHWGTAALGDSPAAVALIIITLSLLLSLVRLPFDWAAQFRLEEKFGFNTTTPRTWWLDRIKGVFLSLLIGYPLLWLIVSFPAWSGPAWWFHAWLAVLAFQLILMFVAPVLILPWFNRFTPLPEGGLRDRLQQLARRTRFLHRDILLMDGSRRSRHSNAFFTGLGRFRRIVLYDTLVSQLAEDELEAVLAHEIGHCRLRHIPRMLAASALGSLILFFLLAQLSGQPWFFDAFGFQSAGLGPLLLIALIFGGAISFWLSPLANAWSRRFEYQADQFSAQVLGNPRPLVHALRKLTQRNLGNLTPHPAYSWFYYSHPTLWERERALNAAEKSDTTTDR
jgi:STE24 endopeptidase